MVYLADEDLDAIFALIAERYGRQEEVPVYRDHKKGIEELLGVLERVQMDTYYPLLLDKATQLLISINKGHFFSNGNKRLALVVMIAFLTLNEKTLKESSKEVYKKLLSSLFPGHRECTDFAEFTPIDFATYNLSIIIADSNKHNLEHDALKARVQSFLSQSVK